MTGEAAATDEAPECDVLILGASFAGIELYHQLRRHRAGRGLQVTIVDRQAEHGYIPLVQELLVGRLPRAASTLPTARCVRDDPRSRFVVDEVVGLDPARREVTLASGVKIRGRVVVVALGSSLTPPPGLPGREYLLGYKFAAEFMAAQRLLQARMAAPGVAHVVVIGGGISGVELAGELAHAAASSGASAAPAMRVTLVDGGERLLRGLTERAGRMAARRLEAQGVTLRLRTRVLEVHADTMRVHTRGGEADALTHDFAFWAGGVRPAPVLGQLALPGTLGGYLAVSPSLQCFPGEARPQVFACGDAVRVIDAQGEWPTMQRAIECLWQAKVVSRNVLAVLKSTPEGPAPRLRAHRLRRDFPHGVSIGAASMVVFGPAAVELGGLGVWFRRFLMRQYFRRYGAPGGAARG